MYDNTENTIGARMYASDHSRRHKDIETNWWRSFSDYRIKKWRDELDELLEDSGKNLTDICKYMGITYTKSVGFYEKLPKKRNMYIAIGMALKQPLETINTWLTRYGEKRRLYAKDLEEDLSWIHLIHSNYIDNSTNRNYYKEFEKCQRIAHEAYVSIWDENINADERTLIVETDVKNIPWDPEYVGLSNMIMTQIDAFKTAWSKPRRLLDKYVDCLLDAGRAGCFRYKINSLNSLRTHGYLDDSMVNYLAGSSDAINVINHKGGKRSPKFKKIPKSKSSHISLALALGMTSNEIDEYIKMMGYAPLDAVHMKESLLLNSIAMWEEEHPEQKKLKRLLRKGKTGKDLYEDPIMRIGANQMLQLRYDLQEIYTEQGKAFPYMK